MVTSSPNGQMLSFYHETSVFPKIADALKENFVNQVTFI